MPLQRLPFWDTQLLHKFLLDNAKIPFCWGSNDCCTFAADAIKSFTGTDIAEDFRGKYKTQTGAIKAIKAITGGSTAEDAVAYVANKHGLVEYKFPLMAKRGDLVVFHNGVDVLAGVVHLTGRHVLSVNDSGAVKLPITDIKRAWAV